MNTALRLIVAGLACTMLFSVTGCAIFQKQEAAASAEGQNDQEKPTSLMGEKLLTAFQKNDAKGFVALLPEPENVRDKFTEKDFKVTRESMVKNLGEPVKIIFVGNLKHPIANVCIWRVCFERQNTDKTETIQQETLFRAVTTKGEKEELLSFNFL